MTTGKIDRLQAAIATLRAFVAERDWAQYHDPKNLSMLLASEAGELLAEYRWIANENADAHSARVPGRARIADEIGDVGIALLLLCDRIGLDLVDAIDAKVARNRERYPVESSRGRAERPINPQGASASVPSAPRSSGSVRSAPKKRPKALRRS